MLLIGLPFNIYFPKGDMLSSSSEEPGKQSIPLYRITCSETPSFVRFLLHTWTPSSVHIFRSTIINNGIMHFSVFLREERKERTWCLNFLRHFSFFVLIKRFRACHIFLCFLFSFPSTLRYQNSARSRHIRIACLRAVYKSHPVILQNHACIFFFS